MLCSSMPHLEGTAKEERQVNGKPITIMPK